MTIENRRETADAAPHPPIRSGLAMYLQRIGYAPIRIGNVSGMGRSDPPVKPTSEVAHQPGQQPATDQSRRVRAGSSSVSIPRRSVAPGSAVECSTERPRAPDRQPVAPVEGRAWETPATRTVRPRVPGEGGLCGGLDMARNGRGGHPSPRIDRNLESPTFNLELPATVERLWI